MSTEASLVVRTGEGERSLAAGRAYLVGRDPQADIVVADFRVSWHHAEFRAQPGLLGSGRPRQQQRQLRRRPPGGPDRDRRAPARSGWAIPKTGRCSTARCWPTGLDYAGLDNTGLATRPRRIGRVPDNDIMVPHPSVSRHHAELHTTLGGYRIVDLGSHNGTFVNEQRVSAATLAEGDTVGFGDTTFRLSGGELLQIADPAPAQMPPAPDPVAEPVAGPVADSRAESGIGAAAGAGPTRPGQALRWPRSRTRCAGWCRGASGSRTSTS